MQAHYQQQRAPVQQQMIPHMVSPQQRTSYSPMQHGAPGMGAGGPMAQPGMGGAMQPVHTPPTRSRGRAASRGHPTPMVHQGRGRPPASARQQPLQQRAPSYSGSESSCSESGSDSDSGVNTMPAHHHQQMVPPGMSPGMPTGQPMVGQYGQYPYMVGAPGQMMAYPQTGRMSSHAGQQRKKSHKKKKKTLKQKMKKDKNAPRRPMTAYGYFSRNVVETVREEVRKTNPDAKQREIMSVVAERWKSMFPSDRQPYEELARKDRLRYNDELSRYHPPSSDSESSSSSSSSARKPKRKKHKKDPAAPKRAKTGYMLFTDENRDRVRAELKQKPGFKNQHVLTELGRLWKLLPEEKKQEYNERVKADKERYHQEVAEYKKRLSGTI